MRKRATRLSLSLYAGIHQHESPRSRVLRVPVHVGEAKTDHLGVLAKFDCPPVSAKVKKEAESCPQEVSDKDIIDREDFRKVFSITIDPMDARF